MEIQIDFKYIRCSKTFDFTLWLLQLTAIATRDDFTHFPSCNKKQRKKPENIIKDT